MKSQQFYNENPDAIGYGMDTNVFERLKSVHYMIFKKGRSMTPDKWRDMENLLALALHDIEPIMENDVIGYGMEQSKPETYNYTPRDENGFINMQNRINELEAQAKENEKQIRDDMKTIRILKANTSLTN